MSVPDTPQETARRKFGFESQYDFFSCENEFQATNQKKFMKEAVIKKGAQNTIEALESTRLIEKSMKHSQTSLPPSNANPPKPNLERIIIMKTDTPHFPYDEGVKYCFYLLSKLNGKSDDIHLFNVMFNFEAMAAGTRLDSNEIWEEMQHFGYGPEFVDINDVLPDMDDEDYPTNIQSLLGIWGYLLWGACKGGTVKSKETWLAKRELTIRKTFGYKKDFTFPPFEVMERFGDLGNMNQAFRRGIAQALFNKIDNSPPDQTLLISKLHVVKDQLWGCQMTVSMEAMRLAARYGPVLATDPDILVEIKHIREFLARVRREYPTIEVGYIKLLTRNASETGLARAQIPIMYELGLRYMIQRNNTMKDYNQNPNVSDYVKNKAKKMMSDIGHYEELQSLNLLIAYAEVQGISAKAMAVKQSAAYDEGAPTQSISGQGWGGINDGSSSAPSVSNDDGATGLHPTNPFQYSKPKPTTDRDNKTRQGIKEFVKMVNQWADNSDLL